MGTGMSKCILSIVSSVHERQGEALARLQLHRRVRSGMARAHSMQFAAARGVS